MLKQAVRQNNFSKKETSMDQTRHVKAYLFFAIFIVLILAFSGCSQSENAADCQYNQVNEPGNYTNTCSLQVQNGARRAELQVDVTLTSGSATWKLIDPDGIICQSGEISGETPFSQFISIEKPEPGNWKLTFDLHEAAGTFETPWKVKF